MGWSSDNSDSSSYSKCATLCETFATGADNTDDDIISKLANITMALRCVGSNISTTKEQDELSNFARLIFNTLNEADEITTSDEAKEKQICHIVRNFISLYILLIPSNSTDGKEHKMDPFCNVIAFYVFLHSKLIVENRNRKPPFEADKNYVTAFLVTLLTSRTLAAKIILAFPQCSNLQQPQQHCGGDRNSQRNLASIGVAYDIFTKALLQSYTVEMNELPSTIVISDARNRWNTLLKWASRIVKNRENEITFFSISIDKDDKPNKSNVISKKLSKNIQHKDQQIIYEDPKKINLETMENDIHKEEAADNEPSEEIVNDKSKVSTKEELRDTSKNMDVDFNNSLDNTFVKQLDSTEIKDRSDVNNPCSELKDMDVDPFDSTKESKSESNVDKSSEKPKDIHEEQLDSKKETNNETNGDNSYSALKDMDVDQLDSAKKSKVEKIVDNSHKKSNDMDADQLNLTKESKSINKVEKSIDMDKDLSDTRKESKKEIINEESDEKKDNCGLEQQEEKNVAQMKTPIKKKSKSSEESDGSINSFTMALRPRKTRSIAMKIVTEEENEKKKPPKRSPRTRVTTRSRGKKRKSI